jgi:hypothetical protein
MKFLVPMLAVMFTGITATAANATGPELYPASGWSAHSTILTNARYRYVRYFHGPRNCCVTGPAYGHPGNWLGPAYNGNYSMPDPRTCGPGACQDNPWY